MMEKEHNSFNYEEVYVNSLVVSICTGTLLNEKIQGRDLGKIRRNIRESYLPELTDTLLKL